MGDSANRAAAVTLPAPSARACGARDGDGVTKFLVELDNTWTMLRLYGTEHPAFRRSAEAAAAAVERPGRVQINPRGFAVSFLSDKVYIMGGKTDVQNALVGELGEHEKGLAIPPGSLSVDLVVA